MDYIQVNCTIQSTELTLIQEMLMHELVSIDYESFTETETGLTAYIAAPSFDASKLDTITFPTDLSLGSIAYSWELIKDQNWNEEWEKNFQPVIIANTCHIRAPFHDPRPDMAYEIVMQPKMAFGTGHHETTSLMVEHMLSLDVANHTVLDMGCGTGVLAILASMLGATSILAIDIDEWAYNSTIENSLANKINNITAQQGDIDLIHGLQFQTILANINRNILLTQMPHYADALIAGGHLLLSGIYKTDLPIIQQSTTANGFSLLKVLEKNNWVAGLFIKD